MEFIYCLIDRLKVVESNGEYLDWASCYTFLKIDFEFQIKKFVHLIQRSTNLAIILLEKNVRRNGIFLAIGNLNRFLRFLLQLVTEFHNPKAICTQVDNVLFRNKSCIRWNRKNSLYTYTYRIETNVKFNTQIHRPVEFKATISKIHALSYLSHRCNIKDGW